jgi:hypothetical protein
MKKANTTISKQQFLTYEQIRQSGVTNMWDVTRVVELAETRAALGNGVPLTEDACLVIMQHYPKLQRKYVQRAAA